MRSACKHISLFPLFLILFTSPSLPQNGLQVREQIRWHIEQLQSEGHLDLQDVDIAFSMYLPRFYENRQFEPVWQREDSVNQLVSAIESSFEDGLNPRDYNLDTLNKWSVDSFLNQPSVRAWMDIVLTDALFRLGYNLTYGKVDPEKLDPVWNIGATIRDDDPGGHVTDAIVNGKITELIDQVRPHNPYYDWFKAALKEYRNIKETAAWKPVPSGPVLKPGASDPRVGHLVERLIQLKDLQSSSDYSDREYTDRIVAGVKRFQMRHGLEVDGVVGPATLRNLNVPVEDRINQIRLNMERTRWVLHELPERFILVNIASFHLFCVNESRIELETRVQVGRPYRKTPVFKDELEYIVFNPTWTIPPGILKKDILPEVIKDLTYLEKKDLEVLSLDGESVDPAVVDWKQARNRFPYMIRQKPGPDNSLGRVKFIFPNKYYVFLHDTPSRNLFLKEQRAFSSGCIRVADPLHLADWVLSGRDSHSLEEIEAIVASEKTQTIHLRDPLPIFLLYWTAFPRSGEEFHFREDIYDRDGPVMEDLDSEFTIRDSILKDSMEKTGNSR